MEQKMIAGIMAEISHNIVWPVIHEICKDHNKTVKHPFSARIGSGNSTYHTLKRHEGKIKHIVTYGQKMIKDKFDHNRAEQWLTGREIIEKGFFSGNMTYPNLIAHTILHEMAHALQVIMGDRNYKSVHNAAFYQWLTLLHKKCGTDVLESLHKKSEQKKISLEFKKQKAAANEQKTEIAETFLKVHKIYQCYFEKKPVLVKLLKINPKRLVVTVIEKNHHENGKSYYVPRHLLHEAPEKSVVKNRMDLNVINENPFDISQIKVFKKYKIELKKRTLIVEVKKKNKTTIVVEIIEGNKDMIGQRWKVPPMQLKAF